MKKILMRLLLALLFFSYFDASALPNFIVDKFELPDTIKNYLKTHFNVNENLDNVLHVLVDKELFSREYKVLLTNNVVIEFDANDHVEEIKSLEGLPNSVIPIVILDYVRKNHPANLIIEWELDKSENKQQIKLNSRIELEFDLKGNFVKFDD